jgi:putative Mn2+ efflux pump MntP
VSERGGRLSPRARDAIALTLVALVFALPLRGLLRAPGPPMEEGFMLVFPERVLHGAIPNRDFLHLYGPGSLWALAGAFKVFGVNLLTERVFGLAQQIAIVFGIYALARRWGRTIAVCSAVTSALIIIPFGLTALAWVGGVGLGVLGLAAGVTARAQPADDRGERRARRRALGAGLLLGLAVLFRLDLALAVGISTIALTRGMGRSRVNRLLAGIAIGIAPYVIQLATAGIGDSVRGMILDPVFHLRGGRSLPIPPPWSHVDGFLQRAGLLQQLHWPIPGLRASQQLSVWFFLLLAVIAFSVVEGVRAVRADRASLRARTILVVSLFSLGILPQALQRVDSAHFAWVSCVPFGFLPVVLYDFARRTLPRTSIRQLSLAAGAVPLAIVLLVLPAFTTTRYADYSLQTFGVHRHSYEIVHDGRTFYYGKKDRADAANLVIDAAARISKPGQRLFVGPGDLRKTPYSDAYLYYELGDLVPATYYIEMDPGVANTADSGLDRQLASADIVILSKIWDNWSEPNDSRKVGSDKAERVLARDFCHVGTYLDLYELYRKCR